MRKVLSGRRVSEYRKRMKLTQAELATKAGVDQAIVSRLETGKIKSFETTIDIANALGVMVDDLLTEVK